MRLRKALAFPCIGLLLFAVVSLIPQTESTAGHVYSSGNWQSLPATPGAIRSSAIAYSPDDQKIVLYGGRPPNNTFFNELWVYDVAMGTWAQKTPWNCSPCPTGRAVHSMTYDDANNRFVVFGGYLVNGHTYETNETWTYNLATNTWTKLNFGAQQVPAPRHWGALKYNPDQQASYLFGGHYNAGACPGDIMYNDVWKLDISGPSPTWTNMDPLADPVNGLPATRQSDWVYSTVDKKFYVFGGKQELGPLSCGSGDTRESFFNDVWKYDPTSNQWTRLQPNKTDYTHYPIERRTDTAYDDANNRMIFFSGFPSTDFKYAADTWIYDFDDGKWSTVQDSDGLVPPSRMQMAAAWDSMNDVMYLYGINNSGPGGSFWKLHIAKNNISINCFSRQPVIFGTDGNDASLLGNKAINVVYSLSGDDTIRGDLAGDFLCGGTGNDKIFGDAGNDKLLGLDGNDEIHGGTGNDDVRGGAGNDKLYGEDGKDRFECGSGTDNIVDFNAAQGDTKTADCEIF